jgi:hypothetical protein
MMLKKGSRKYCGCAGGCGCYWDGYKDGLRKKHSKKP